MASNSSSSGCKSYGLHSVCLIITAMPVEPAYATKEQARINYCFYCIYGMDDCIVS